MTQRAMSHLGHLDRLRVKGWSHQELELWLARQDFLLYSGQVVFGRTLREYNSYHSEGLDGPHQQMSPVCHPPLLLDPPLSWQTSVTQRLLKALKESHGQRAACSLSSSSTGTRLGQRRHSTVPLGRSTLASVDERDILPEHKTGLATQLHSSTSTLRS